MNKNNMIFKIFSFSVLSINLIFLGWLVLEIIKVVNKTIVFKNIHLILLICIIVLNLAYVAFISFKLIKNNKINNNKLKNLK